MLGRRQHLEGHLGHGSERAETAGEQLAQIVAGDVLHHPPAGLDQIAAPGDRLDAEEVVARGPGLDPARAGQIAGKHAADGAAPGLAAQQRSVVRRLECQLLVALGKARLDLRKRCPGPR